MTSKLKSMNSRSNLKPFQIIDMLRKKVSFPGILKLNDTVELNEIDRIKNTNELQLYKKRLEILERKLEQNEK
jgi:hypothetical protein